MLRILRELAKSAVGRFLYRSQLVDLHRVVYIDILLTYSGMLFAKYARNLHVASYFTLIF